MHFTVTNNIKKADYTFEGFTYILIHNLLVTCKNLSSTYCKGKNVAKHFTPQRSFQPLSARLLGEYRLKGDRL